MDALPEKVSQWARRMAVEIDPDYEPLAPMYLAAYLRGGKERKQLFEQTATVAGLLMLVLAAFFAKLATGGITPEVLARLLDLSRSFFCGRAWLFAGMAMLILPWPLMVSRWERLFCTAGRRYRRWDKGGALASLLLAIVAAWV